MAQEIVLDNALELRAGAKHGSSGEATLQLYSLRMDAGDR